MPTIIPVLDSNLYRSLSDDAFSELVEKEAALSIVPVASYYVATEFLAHVADRNLPTFGIGYKSLQRLWTHTRVFDGSRYVMNLVAHASNQMAFTLFGTKSDEQSLAVRQYGSLVGEVANTAPADVGRLFGNELRLVAKLVDRAEVEFTDILWNSVVKTLAPEATDWYSVTRDTSLRSALLRSIDEGYGLRWIAQAFVLRVANEYSLNLDQESLDEKTKLMLKVFPTPVHLYNRLVRRIVENGIDMTKQKRANSIFDVHITFSTGRGAAHGLAPRILVTDDKDVLESAVDAASRDQVMSVGEYYDLISLDWLSFNNAMAEYASAAL